MKIIHTADWHIGKKLHNYDLAEDFDCFIDWLIKLIQKEAVDVLLVSGDLFDLANPSSAARNQYYESLVRLKQHVPHIILTGGNHDSPAVLNATKELLKVLNLDVVGGLPKQLKEALFPLKNKEGEIELVVAAIPFLRNPDIPTDGKIIKSYTQRLATLRRGITSVFEAAARACKENYPGVPALAMGHLYTAGIEESDSERDIQIGNQAAVDSSAFDAYFKYLALGHIHKPQRIAAQQPAFYSGSPIPLSFSERKDEKRVLLIDTKNGWEPKSVAVPAYRKLIRLIGNLEELRIKLSTLEQVSNQSIHLIEVELREDQFQTKIIDDLERLVSDFENPGYEIVKHRVKFKTTQRQIADIYSTETDLNELDPAQVFTELLDQNEYPEDERKAIESAFYELLEQND